jgi:hypothetical protein
VDTTYASSLTYTEAYPPAPVADSATTGSPMVKPVVPLPSARTVPATSRPGTRTGLGPSQTAAVLSDTIAALPTFCDLLTHVPLSLEGDVDIERARRYKINAFAAHDDIVRALGRASVMTHEQTENLLPAALAFAANFWQLAHPTPTLAQLYEQVPHWGHAAFDFAPRLGRLLAATAIGLTETITPAEVSRESDEEEAPSASGT